MKNPLELYNSFKPEILISVLASSILNNRLSNYGILNLWKGISTIYIRTLPSSILGMVVYEETKKNNRKI